LGLLLLGFAARRHFGKPAHTAPYLEPPQCE
jgi:hypothetical protein